MTKLLGKYSSSFSFDKVMIEGNSFFQPIPRKECKILVIEIVLVPGVAEVKKITIKFCLCSCIV